MKEITIADEDIDTTGKRDLKKRGKIKGNQLKLKSEISDPVPVRNEKGIRFKKEAVT